MIRFLHVVLFFVLCLACPARTVTGKVVRVSDGDTVTLLLTDNSQLRVRLYGIDAPEMKGGQPYSRQARKYLSSMVAGQVVNVKVKGHDRYNRTIGKIFLADGTDVGLRMIQNGYAWHYARFDNSTLYKDAERKARKNRVGLWQDRKPVNPYNWRNRYK